MKEDRDMLKKALMLLCLTLAGGIVSQTYAADTPVIPKVTVISTKFVEKIEGVNDAGAKDSWQVRDPKRGLILVMSVKADLDAERSFLTSDFSVKYLRKGEVSMADCIAITPGAASKDSVGRWLIGNCGDKVCNAREKMKKGTVYFQLAFEPMEPDVKMVDLQFAVPVLNQIKVR